MRRAGACTPDPHDRLHRVRPRGRVPRRDAGVVRRRRSPLDRSLVARVRKRRADPGGRGGNRAGRDPARRRRCRGPRAAISSRPMLAKLLAKAGGAPPFPLVEGDTTRMPFADDPFGGAYLRWVLVLVPDWSAAVAEIVRVVEPGGRILAPRSGPTRRALEVRLDSATSPVPRRNRRSERGTARASSNDRMRSASARERKPTSRCRSVTETTSRPSCELSRRTGSPGRGPSPTTRCEPTPRGSRGRGPRNDGVSSTGFPRESVGGRSPPTGSA